MKDTVKKALRWIPGILISGGIIAYLSTQIDISELLSSLKSIPLATILSVIVITFIANITRAVMWNKFLPAIKFKDVFYILNESYLFNNIIPRSGELVKTILFAPPSGKSAFEILSSVIVERSLDILIAAAMFLSTFPFIAKLESIRPIAIALLIAFCLFLCVCFFVASKSEWVKKQLRQIFREKELYTDKILPRIENVIDGFKILTNGKQFLAILTWLLITWALWTGNLYITMIAIDPRVELWWSLFTQGVLALGIALPSAPAGLGVFEGTVVAALSVFDISPEKALVVGVFVHLVQIIMTTILGIIGIVRQGDSIAAILGRIRSSKEKDT